MRCSKAEEHNPASLEFAGYCRRLIHLRSNVMIGVHISTMCKFIVYNIGDDFQRAVSNARVIDRNPDGGTI